MLNIEVSSAGEIRLAGRLDAVEAPAAQVALDKISGTVAVDCSALEYISSAGLGVLLKTQKRLAGAGGRQPAGAGELAARAWRSDDGFSRVGHAQEQFPAPARRALPAV